MIYRYYGCRRRGIYHDLWRVKCIPPNTSTRQNRLRDAERKITRKNLPFGVVNALFIFARVMLLALVHFGPERGLLVYMGDCIYCSFTWETRLATRRHVHSTASSRPQPQTHDVQLGPKQVFVFKHVMSADGIRVGDDRIKALIINY